jgi:hypothetical protein
LQEVVRAWSAGWVVKDLTSMPVGCFYNAAMDDSHVLTFLKAFPLLLRDLPELTAKAQPTEVILACILSTDTQTSVREPRSKSSILEMCQQPWGPNYFIGEPTLMNWQHSLMEAKNRKYQDAWMSQTRVTAVSCLQPRV